MKTINYVLLAFMSFTLALSSCTKSTDLSDAIPSNAKCVLRIDNNQLIKKSGYDIFQNEAIVRNLNLAKSFINKEQLEILNSFLKDANSLGLNLKNEIYLFSFDEQIGLLIGVNDANRIKQLMVKLLNVEEKSLTKNGDTYFVSIENYASLSWNDSKLIVLLNNSSSDNESVAKRLLSQDKSKSINSLKEYQEFKENFKEISLFYSMKYIDEIQELVNGVSPAIDTLSPTLPKSVEGVFVGFYTSFEQGEIQYNSKYFYTSPESEEKLKEYISSINSNIKGDHLKYMTEEPLLAVTMNLNGKKIDTTDVEDTPIIHKVMNGIDGDLTFVLTKLDTINDNFGQTRVVEPLPRFYIMVDVKNSVELLGLLKEYLSQTDIIVSEISSSIFLLKEKNANFYFGFSNNTFFITDIDSVYQNLNNQNLKNDYTEKIKDKSLFVFGNIQPLNQFLINHGASMYLSKNDISTLIEITKYFNLYEWSVSSTDFNSNGFIKTANKTENSLETISQLIDKQITMTLKEYFPNLK